MLLRRSKGLTWPMLVFALVTTLIYMAGLAALQASCNDIPRVAAGTGLFGRSAFGASDPGCYRMFRFYWFIFAFVAATLIGILITSVMQLGLHFSRPFWVGMVTICALLMMIASEFFLGSDNALEGSWPGTWMHHRWRTATAGAIMSVISLVLLLMAIGTDWDRYGHSHVHDDKLTGRHTTTTTTAGAPVVDRV